MIVALMTAAFAQAAAPAAVAPATAPGRTLAALPNTTITYFDVPGKKGPEIKKALDQILADPARGASVKLFTWDVGAKILKRTEGTKCTVQSATPTLTAKVNLPRLASEAKVAKPVLDNWRTYVSSLETEAAQNLWFINDRLPAAQKAMTGIDCAKTRPTWDAALARINADLNAFMATRAAAAAPVPAATAPKPKS
jgi:predicted secreted Zn-dependent protease